MAELGEDSTPRPAIAHLYWLLPLTFVLYLPSLAATFIYDDIPLIVENTYAHSFEHVWRAFSTHFWDLSRGENVESLHYYRPLVSLSYMLDWQLGSGAAWVFHLHNVVLHTLAVGLALRWCQRFLKSTSTLWLLPVFLFAFHPTRLESVVWISGRTDLWLSVWLLLSIELARVARNTRRTSFLVLSGLCTIAALLSKETAVILPLLLLADRAAESHGARGSNTLYHYADVLVTGALSVGYLVCRWLWLPVGSQLSPFTPRSFLAAAEGYAERLLWPVPDAFFFRPMAIDENGNLHATWQLMAGGLVVLAGLWLVSYAFRQQRAAFWLLAGVIASMAPVLQLVPTGLPVLVADRFLYLPLLLLPLALARLFQAPLENLLDRFPRASLGVAVTIPLSLAASLAFVVPSYASEHAFWQTELSQRRCTPAAHEHLAKLAAAQADLAAAQAHLLTMLSPECINETLYHRQLPLRAYARSLQIEASHTADGDREKLMHIATRLSELYQGKLRPKPAIRGLREPPALFFEVLNRQRPRLPDRGAIAAEVASLYTRLGHDQEARGWATRALERPLTEQASPANLALTLTRLGEFGQARALISRLEQENPGGSITPDQLSSLDRQIGQTAGAWRDAEGASAEQAALLRAEAQANLGAYGRAVRILQPYLGRGASRPMTVLYVQLLVAARLEREAFEVLSRAEPAPRARQILAQIQRGLSPELQRIAPFTSAPTF